MKTNAISAVIASLLFALSHSPGQSPGRFSDKIGVELDGLGDGSREQPFTDLAKTLRPWTGKDGKAVPVDERGWPLSDATTVLFDIRPFPIWNSPADDPDKFQPDWSGAYKLSFHGQATLELGGDPGLKIAGQKYNAATNVTSADIVVSRGAGLLTVGFKGTKRRADGPEDSGITDLKVLRPGIPEGSKAVFSAQFLNSLKPFAVLRFMDWLETNRNPGFYGDPGHHALRWVDRHLPDDATQLDYGNKYGVAWEYVVALANLAHKDIWINIPVAATDDYVKHLASFLKENLNPRCNIYIEHSNEVWNFAFPQYIYNKLAALDEAKQGSSRLTADGAKDPEVLAHRRHAKRLIEIGAIFRNAFGMQGASRIRPVYASWTISPKEHYEDVLEWVAKTYGPPRNYFHALAGAAYYNIDKTPPTADVDALITAMRASSDAILSYRTQIQNIATHYGLKHFQYEIGPDVGGGKTVNLANRIRSNRDPRMKDLLLHDARDNWFAHGGDLYMYFSHCCAYSRFGCWGLSEDIADLTTPKWQAIYELTGATPPAPANQR